MGSAGRVVAQYRVSVRDAVNVRLHAVSVEAGSVLVLRERRKTAITANTATTPMEMVLIAGL